MARGSMQRGIRPIGLGRFDGMRPTGGPVSSFLSFFLLNPFLFTISCVVISDLHPKLFCRFFEFGSLPRIQLMFCWYNILY
jgi:hypothetical protein